MGRIEAVCISEQKGTQKQAVDSGVLRAEHGLVGDSHAGSWHRQVSLLTAEEIDAFARRGGLTLAPGAFGENLVVSGLALDQLPVGTRLACGEALLAVTQIGKECHHDCAIRTAVGDCIMPRQGVFARVLRGGTIAAGDEIRVVSPWRAAVITVSDKGARGQRRDESGPLASQMLEEAGFAVVEQLMLPDEREQLSRTMRRLCDEALCELIVTTGGTGFAPRDQTPEATLDVIERLTPGIPEAMRLNSLQVTKRAMLSRAVAGIRGRTLIINLPGSPKAVRENLAVVLPELGHGLAVLVGEGGDCAQEAQP